MKSARIFTIAFATVLGTVLTTQTATAELVLNVGQNGVVFDSHSGDGSIPEFQVIGGETLQLELYVTQQGTFQIPMVPFPIPDFRLSTSDPVNGDITTGLSAFGVRFDRTTSTGALTNDFSVSFVSIGDGFLLNDLGGSNQDLDIGRDGFAGLATDLSDPTRFAPVFATQPPNVDPRGDRRSNSVLMGVVNVDIAEDAIGSYRLEIAELGRDLSFFNLGSNPFNGSFIPTTGAVNIVAAIPEPSSMALLAGVGGFVAMRVRRRRVKATVAS
ncbi:MAG: PEP-CTERM sorting domain-containing protein [Planctomycetota bacterium]